jgi:hypothetical protein
VRAIHKSCEHLRGGGIESALQIDGFIGEKENTVGGKSKNKRRVVV